MTHISDNVDYEVLSGLARGCYQRNLLRGVESWSGSTLRGRARDYARRYAWSRAGLLDRIRAAGYVVREGYGERGRREVTIDVPAAPARTAAPAQEAAAA